MDYNDFIKLPKEKQTEEICLAVVKEYGLLLKYVKNQTPEICLAAVKSNGMALEFVEDQTEEICLEAVKKCDWALKFVKNQTEEICIEAVKQYGWGLQYVKEQTPEICLTAIKRNPDSECFMNIVRPDNYVETAEKIRNKVGLDLLNEAHTPNMIKLDLMIRLSFNRIISEDKARSILETIVRDYNKNFVKDDTEKLCCEHEKQYLQEALDKFNRQKELEKFIVDAANELERLKANKL